MSFEDENNGEDPLKEAYELGIKQGQKAMQAELTSLKQRIDGIYESVHEILFDEKRVYTHEEAEQRNKWTKQIHDKIKGV